MDKLQGVQIEYDSKKYLVKQKILKYCQTVEQRGTPPPLHDGCHSQQSKLMLLDFMETCNKIKDYTNPQPPAPAQDPIFIEGGSWAHDTVDWLTTTELNVFSPAMNLNPEGTNPYCNPTSLILTSPSNMSSPLSHKKSLRSPKSNLGTFSDFKATLLFAGGGSQQKAKTPGKQQMLSSTYKVQEPIGIKPKYNNADLIDKIVKIRDHLQATTFAQKQSGFHHQRSKTGIGLPVKIEQYKIKPTHQPIGHQRSMSGVYQNHSIQSKSAVSNKGEDNVFKVRMHAETKVQQACTNHKGGLKQYMKQNEITENLPLHSIDFTGTVEEDLDDLLKLFQSFTFLRCMDSMYEDVNLKLTERRDSECQPTFQQEQQQTLFHKAHIINHGSTGGKLKRPSLVFPHNVESAFIRQSQNLFGERKDSLNPSASMVIAMPAFEASKGLKHNDRFKKDPSC